MNKSKTKLNLFNGSDKILDRKKDTNRYEEGLILRDGSTITIKQLGSHQSLSLTYLLHLFIENPNYLYDYLKYKNEFNDVREFIYFRAGIVLLGSNEPRYAIYDKNIINDAQQRAIEKLDLDAEFQADIDKDFKNPYDIDDIQSLLKNSTISKAK